MVLLPNFKIKFLKRLIFTDVYNRLSLCKTYDIKRSLLINVGGGLLRSKGL